MKKQFLLKTMLLLCALVVGSSSVWAEEIIYSETFGTTGNKTDVSSYTGFSSSLITPTSSGWKISDTSTSTCGLSGSSGSCNAYCGGTSDLVFNFGNKLSQYTSVKLSFNYNKGSANGKANTLKLYISGDGGTTYGSDLLPSNTGASSKWYAVTNISIPVTSLANLRIKFSSSTNTNRIDDIVITGVPAAPAAPTFAGEFSEAFTLHLASTTSGASIYYTTDGSAPTSSSTAYDNSVGISIPAATTTVKAIAIKGDKSSEVSTATYTYVSVAQPLFGTESGTAVYYGTKVTASCATEGASLYYTKTTDGSEPADPTDASTAYPNGGITIDANTTKIKIIAKSGETYSSVAAATYTLKTPEAPTIEPAAGAVERGTTVTLSSADGTTIYYTTNNTTPTASSTEYTGPITIDAAKTIKAVAIDGAENVSETASAAYTILKVATPAFSVGTGTTTLVAKGTSITLTCSTEGATIYYTTDGTAPTSSSKQYIGAIVINKGKTLKAIAVKDNYDDSEVATAVYTVSGESETVVFKNCGFSNAEAVTEIKGTDVTYTFDKADASNDPAYYNTGEGVRMYNGSTLTIACSTKTMAAIEFTFSGSYTTLSKVNGQPGTLSDATNSVRKWTGSANSVKFTTS